MLEAPAGESLWRQLPKLGLQPLSFLPDEKVDLRRYSLHEKNGQHSGNREVQQGLRSVVGRGRWNCAISWQSFSVNYRVLPCHLSAVRAL